MAAIDGFTIHVLDVILFTYNKIRIITSYLFLYVSYYSISHRINCLRYVLKDTVNDRENIPELDPMTNDPRYLIDPFIDRESMTIFLSLGLRASLSWMWCR